MPVGGAITLGCGLLTESMINPTARNTGAIMPHCGNAKGNPQQACNYFIIVRALASMLAHTVYKWRLLSMLLPLMSAAAVLLLLLRLLLLHQLLGGSIVLLSCRHDKRNTTPSLVSASGDTEPACIVAVQRPAGIQFIQTGK